MGSRIDTNKAGSALIDDRHTELRRGGWVLCHWMDARQTETAWRRITD